MSFNQFNTILGEDIENQHQWALHRWAKIVERWAENVLWKDSRNLVAATLTNIVDHMEAIINPIFDTGREIAAIKWVKDTAKTLFLHTPLAIIESAFATAKSVVWIPAKFMIRFPMRTFRDLENSNFWPKYDWAKTFWKWAATGLWGIWWAAYAGWIATSWAITSGTFSAASLASVWAFWTAIAPIAWIGAVMAPVTEFVAWWINRTLSNIRTSEFVSNRTDIDRNKDWYSNTVEYWTATDKYTEQKAT